MSKQEGFTLVEVIVAIVILTVGLLGIVGATGQLTRMQGQGDRLATAAFHAQDRIEQLRAGGCTAAVGGNTTVDAIYIMTWTVGGQASGNRPVLVEVEYPTGTATAAIDSFETWIPCP